MSQSDWYHAKASECNRMALPSTSATARDLISRTVIIGARLPRALRRQRKLQKKKNKGWRPLSLQLVSAIGP
jgi:hypothetical protein